MTSLKTKFSTALALGIPNLLRVLTYRATIKLGINPVRRISAEIPSGVFFRSISSRTIDIDLETTGWLQTAKLFGHIPFNVGDTPPRWDVSPASGYQVKNSTQPWWTIPDFDSQVGDIKAIWELSRFDWAIGFAQQSAAGNKLATDRLNSWLNDWATENPPYLGPNWKCGQEASIRVMHLAMSALITQQVENTSKPLLALIELHLKRIEPTISYAIAQDNNHGTSEAAALFIGGSWLELHGIKKGRYWRLVGAEWLENRALRLIENDGSFSQYSLNYHRVMIDTFCMVEVWRRHLSLPSLSNKWYEKCRKAAHWLYSLVDSDSGDGPNIGANDGARLLQLTNSDYRDFRPSVQLAMILFAGQVAYAKEDIWNLPARWLNISIPSDCANPPKSEIYDDGGYAMLRRPNCFALLRYGRFRFRPSQADGLHVDLWVNGKNILRDAGTYSYNPHPSILEYFSGTKSHNTVEFDDRDQMPRISRFLFGDWIRSFPSAPLVETQESVSFTMEYASIDGPSHRRMIELSDQMLTVNDQISNFQNKAILRWRLIPGDWILTDTELKNDKLVLSISSSTPIKRIELIKGWESRYYLQRTQLPVLEVEVDQPCILTSIISWNEN